MLSMNNASARYPRTSGCCCKKKLINFYMTESVALEKIFTTSACVSYITARLVAMASEAIALHMQVSLMHTT